MLVDGVAAKVPLMTDPATPTPEADPPDSSDPPVSSDPKDSPEQSVAGEQDSAAKTGEASDAPPVRAFAQGTGILLQVVGVTLFLTTCCVCSSAWVWDPIYTTGEMERQINEENVQPIPTLRTMFKDPGTAGFSLMVAFSTVGGLAMAVFGLGLQADKPKAAIASVVTVGLWIIVLLGSGICLWIGDGSIAARIWNFLLFALACVLMCFTVTALKQIRKNPPPLGMDILPADWEPPKRMRH